MLSAQDNQMLAKTGPGTPMGELFRRFWLPALLPNELPEADSPPVRLRILNEDLIAFRDTNGKVGVVANACPHRGASLFFGRNEEEGLRCVYHGWKFDRTGACVDMPSEPAESNFKTKARVQAYPAAEFGGIVWVYMGPPEKQPPLPLYEWFLGNHDVQPTIYKWMQECNWAQGQEGNIDTAHVTFLHRRFENFGFRGTNPDLAPYLEVMPTDFGFVYGGRRVTPEGKYYWRVTPYALPGFTTIPGASSIGAGFFVLPVDDEHCWWWTISPRRGDDRNAPGNNGYPYIELIPGSWRMTRNKDNDYMIDREMQRTVNFTGLPTNRTQDAAVIESMGPIMDRTHEHLGRSDAAIIYMRRLMIEAAKQLQQGIEPEILQHPEWSRVRPLDIVTEEPKMAPLWQQHYAEYMQIEPVAVPAPVS
jgi:phenylpropionate dioxygenase-like ring-hydroxylating dioxygenase large terminal subunit